MTRTDNTAVTVRWRVILSALAVGAVTLAMIGAAQASNDDASGDHDDDSVEEDDDASGDRDEDDESVEEIVGVGFFYGTFGESPNQFLLVGGTAEEFCESSPSDPFGGGEPGSAEAKTSFQQDGSVRTTIDESDQPIYVYETDVEDAPPWIEQVCAEYFATGATPTPFASGEGELDVRDTFVSPAHIEIFNGVSGEVTAPDGTEYRVQAAADFILVDGAPNSRPDQFVSYSLTPKD